MPAYIDLSINEFLGYNDERLLGELHRNYAADRFLSQYTSQTAAWDSSLGLLRSQLRAVAGEEPLASEWRLLLEYPLYRLRRRIDAVVVTDRLAVVIEVKVGETQFRASDCRQAEEYALDLRDFHEPSSGITLLPVLWCTGAESAPTYIEFNGVGVAEVHKAGRDSLGDLLVRAHNAGTGLPRLAKETWSAGAYRPVPTVIEAATTLFAGHSVENIARADASNLASAAERIVELIARTRAEGGHSLIFLTGVPGSGKTLAGLQVVHRTGDLAAEEKGDTVYLSGNTPLVTVLREALTRDEFRRRVDQGAAVRKSEIRNSMRARIQHIIDFLRQYLTDSSLDPPHEHVIVFDEAQRAWDAVYGSRKFDRAASEPSLLLEIMGRHETWSVLIGLIGGGQEINTGENGIAEWGDALRALSPELRAQWTVFGPSSVLEGDRSTAFIGLGELPDGIRVVRDDALRLEVPLRTFRSPLLADWVEAVLSGDQEEAARAASKISGYPLMLTRDLGAARGWLRAVGRGKRRYGLVASSGASRLRAEGLGVSLNASDGNKIAHWYLNDPDDVRSSFALEVTANEYTTQGLELDFVGLCWGGDCRRSQTGWETRQFRGNRWVAAKADRRRFVLNSYRVLLTRAREGLVVWVPRGNEDDPTRDPRGLDRTARFLAECGMTPIQSTHSQGKQR